MATRTRVGDHVGRGLGRGGGQHRGRARASSSFVAHELAYEYNFYIGSLHGQDLKGWGISFIHIAGMTPLLTPPMRL